MKPPTMLEWLCALTAAALAWLSICALYCMHPYKP